jgi:hypothetical protein
MFFDLMLLCAAIACTYLTISCAFTALALITTHFNFRRIGVYSPFPSVALVIFCTVAALCVWGLVAIIRYADASAPHLVRWIWVWHFVGYIARVGYLHWRQNIFSRSVDLAPVVAALFWSPAGPFVLLHLMWNLAFSKPAPKRT